MDAIKQFLLVEELEMVAEPTQHLFAQHAGLHIGIHLIGVNERADAIGLPRILPRVRQEAAEQIRLLPLQQRIVAHRIEERRLSRIRLIFTNEVTTQHI